MDGLSRIFAEKPGGKRTATAQQRLRTAYSAVVSGNGSREDAEIVFSDLADFSGYFGTTPPGVESTEMWYREGRRSVMERIIALADPTPEEKRALSEAVKVEMLTDVQQENDYG